ncbi:hypothetical protein AC579_2258 [Pseudocercospora musae]|uniref:Uncharacterized protein n=1 Tax=Pseudocercospora musae TaxID=113226 RepID=A0A139IUV4_9PEZI|nr:hypothetical protein AC579_2258 [Pseudocercospora musae]
MPRGCSHITIWEMGRWHRHSAIAIPPAIAIAIATAIASPELCDVCDACARRIARLEYMQNTRRGLYTINFDINLPCQHQSHISNTYLYLHRRLHPRRHTMLDPHYTSHYHHKNLAVNLWLQDLPSPNPRIVHPATYALPQSTITNRHICAPCTMVRASEKSLSNLASSGTVLLFTPVVHPAGALKATSKTAAHVNIDPFESLGRALSRYHKRIRHVPYVPRVGFTETHDAFLSHADAVIVVMCEPETSKHEGLASQGDFADSANDALKESLCGRPMKYPLIVIQCGNQEGTWWPDASSFDTLIKCRSYDQDMALAIAKRLFS